MNKPANSIESILDHGYLLLKSGKFNEAEKVFSGANKESPKHIGILKGLAKTYLELQDFEKASVYFSEALDIERQSLKKMNSNIEHANALMQEKKYEEAEALLLKIEKQWPEHIRPFHLHHRLLEIKRRNTE